MSMSSSSSAGSTPEEIQEEIERTRQDLKENVDALQEKVSPSGMANRSAERMKDSVTQVKDKIMGSADSGVSSAKESVASARDTVSEVPTRARRTTQGNPLAVGLGAFAVGWLIGSLLPASQKEQDVVQKAVDSDVVKPLQETAQNVVASAQESGRQALQEVAQEAKSGAEQVKETVKQ